MLEIQQRIAGSSLCKKGRILNSTLHRQSSIETDDERHQDHDQKTVDENQDLGWHLHSKQQAVYGHHHQDTDVLAEVLHGNRFSCREHLFAAVLQQCVHGHDEGPA